MAQALWRDEAALEAWVNGPEERESIRLGKEALVSSTLVRRFSKLGEDHQWRRE